MVWPGLGIGVISKCARCSRFCFMIAAAFIQVLLSQSKLFTRRSGSCFYHHRLIRSIPLSQWRGLDANTFGGRSRVHPIFLLRNVRCMWYILQLGQSSATLDDFPVYTIRLDDKNITWMWHLKWSKMDNLVLKAKAIWHVSSIPLYMYTSRSLSK